MNSDLENADAEMGGVCIQASMWTTLCLGQAIQVCLNNIATSKDNIIMYEDSKVEIENMFKCMAQLYLELSILW